MLRDRLKHSLQNLGIDDTNYRVLKLLPLVYVAWSNGTIDGVERRRLLDLAQTHFKIGKRGEAILTNWLVEQPTAAYFREGLHDVLLLAHAPDEWEFDVDELPGLLVHAEAIARASAEAMGAPFSVNPDEERALREVAAELGVDDGESWAALLAELAPPKAAQA
jgi:hypothetical protein